MACFSIILTPISTSFRPGNMCTRGDQKVRGKVLLNHITSIDRNENSQIQTTIHRKLTEIEI